MPRVVSRFVLGAIDIRGDDTIEVAPTDNETQRDTALVNTYGNQMRVKSQLTRETWNIPSVLLLAHEMVFAMAG